MKMDINDLISPSRLKTYETVLKIKTNEKKLSAYYWNKAISASLFPAMQCLEVSLRNSISGAVKNNPPPSVPCFTDLLTQNVIGVDDWLEYLISYTSLKKIKKLDSRNKKKWIVNNQRTSKTYWEENQLTKAGRDLSRYGKQVTPDGILASLTIGFWKFILSKEFDDVSTGTLLWPNLTRHVFPNLPPGKDISDVRKIMERLCHFRNRFSHHEPVFKFYYEHADGSPNYLAPVFGRAASLSILKKTYSDILDIIKWISYERYNSFVKHGLSNQFDRLIHDDGFYSYVDPLKITTNINYSKSKREYGNILDMMNQNKVFRIDKKGEPYFIFGPM